MEKDTKFVELGWEKSYWQDIVAQANKCTRLLLFPGKGLPKVTTDS